MNRGIKISIITVVYNGERFLEQAINSVLKQTYRNIEYILIDGGSTDKTVDIIKKYESQIAYWVSEPDKGIYDAINKGIEKATGELIGIINSDDWYELDTLENVAKMYDPDTVIYGLIKNWSNESPVNISSFFPTMIPEKMIPHPTCFVPKNIYQKYGIFDLNYKSCADYQFVLRLYRSGVKFVMIEKVLSNFRLGGVSWSLGSLRESYNMMCEMGYMSRTEKNLRLLSISLGRLFRKVI